MIPNCLGELILNVSPVKLEETTIKFKAELEAVQQEIYELAGETFNIVV